MSDESTFFEYGKVSLLLSDYESRTVSVEISMPCSLFQTVVPQLLAHGQIDYLKIREPIAVWIPQLADDRFSENARVIKGIGDRINVALKEEASRTIKLFIHLQDHLKDPSDIIPILPLGIYVTFNYKCFVDRIMNILVGIESIPVFGIPEFQWSLASVLNQVLQDFMKVYPGSHLIRT
jgi:hypothetical protein